MGWRSDIPKDRWTEGGACTCDALAQRADNRGLRRVTSDNERHVYARLLADPVHPSDPLFQPRGVPGQVQAHDPPRACLQVEPLARNIGRNEHPRVAGEESSEFASALVSRLAAMEN